MLSILTRLPAKIKKNGNKFFHKTVKNFLFVEDLAERFTYLPEFQIDNPYLTRLKQIAGKLRQVASFAFYQIDMCKNILSAHAVNHVNQPVGMHIKIR